MVEKDVQHIVDMKIDVKQMQSEPNNAAKNDGINNAGRGNNLNKQQTINGRKLEYPVGQNNNIAQDRKMR
jgi:hypothetical protein